MKKWQDILPNAQVKKKHFTTFYSSFPKQWMKSGKESRATNASDEKKQ